jgi:hypothetical protein
VYKIIIIKEKVFENYKRIELAYGRDMGFIIF